MRKEEACAVHEQRHYIEVMSKQITDFKSISWYGWWEANCSIN
jgi:hypothetical protein